MREAGIKLRETLLNVDFELQDSFCDSTDLKASGETTMMPAPLTDVRVGSGLLVGHSVTVCK